MLVQMKYVVDKMKTLFIFTRNYKSNTNSLTKMWKIIKSWFISNYPIELTPERDNEIIEHLAKILSQDKMEPVIKLFIEPFIPVSTVFSETILVWTSPFLDLMGLKGYEHSLFLRKKENIRHLIIRANELRMEKNKLS